MPNSFQLLLDMIQRRRKLSNNLMDFTPFGYMWVRLDGKKLVASHTIYSMLEMEPYAEFLTVEAWKSFVHPKDLYKLIQAEEELLHTGNPTAAEYRLITKSGRQIFVNHQMYLSGLQRTGQKIMSLVRDVTEEKSAEIILEAMNESFFELDENFSFRRINEHAMEFWKLDQLDMAGKELTAVFPQIEGTEFNNMLLRSQAEKTSISQDVIDPVTGHWLHLSVSPYADGLVAIFYDIQNEKDAEKEVLRLNEELAKKATDKYLSLFNSIDEGFCIVEVLFDKNGNACDYRFLEANNSFEKQTGLVNAVGKTMKELVPGYEQYWFDIYGRIAKTGRSERFENESKELKRYFDVYAFRIDEPKEHVAILFKDITERKRAEKALQESEAKYLSKLEQEVQQRTDEIVQQHAILKQAEELAQAGSWEYNVKTNEFLWSDGMYRLFEIKKEQNVTPEIYLEYAFKDDLPVAKKIVAAIRENFESVEETMRIKFNGSYKSLRIKTTPLKNEKGQIEKMLGVDIDISHTQQAEEKIMALNRSLLATNRELNSLNTELKTFTSIAANNYVETLRHLYINLEMIVTNDARNLSNSGRANLRRAQGAIQKMKLTTDDLVSLSRLHEISAKENDVDLNSILQNVIDDFKKQPVYSLIEINCDHLPLINGYPSLLSLLFHHLIDNAVKFRKSDKDHVVNVTCKEAISGNDLAHETAEKNIEYHVISVEDNGIGFPQTESEEIFKTFYRLNDKSKYKGSGTGLALCKKIMEMHGGFITAEGVPDEGASFHCFFPVL